MRKGLFSLLLCSFLCLCAVSCGHDNNGQVVVSGEDYEYHLYNTHTAATEDYLLARTAMGDTYLIPTSDNTRMEGSCQLDIDLNLFCGFDIGGDAVFFTNKGKVYSIKIDDLVTKAIHGRPILENLKPAVDGSFPKYKDGKLYVTDTPEEKLDSTYNLGELKKHTTSVYDVTISPWELVEQGTDILYPEYHHPDLSKAQVQLNDEIKEHTTGWYSGRSTAISSNVISTIWLSRIPFITLVKVHHLCLSVLKSDISKRGRRFVSLRKLLKHTVTQKQT